MTALIKPWETGSEFHWMLLPPVSGETTLPINAQLYSCGRTALASLLQFGMASLGWKRLWIPTYYCPEVVDTIFSTGIELAFYYDAPFDSVSLPSDIKHGDTILVVNFFGVKSMEEYAGVFQLGIPCIEDHSHDPWSTWAMENRADYNIASFRKTLPIPDGGAVWSNSGAQLPEKPVGNSRSASEIGEKIEAMLLKTIYLAGGLSEKEKYLMLFNHAKTKLAYSTRSARKSETPISTISEAILNVFPLRSWRTQRVANLRYLQENLSGWADVEIMEQHGFDMCPFMFTLLFSSREKRDIVKNGLISHSIYPAIIWSLEEKSCDWAGTRATELSGRILSIHCDGRYSLEDMDRIVAVLSEFADS